LTGSADRLGEALVARLLRQTSDQGIAVLDGVAHLPADDQVVRAMDVLTRLSATDDAAAMATARMLAAHHSELVRRAEGQARGAPGRPGHYDLANAILRPLAQQLGARVREVLARDEPANTTYQRDLATSYERLGDMALQSGQAEEAERQFARAVRTRRALSQQERGRLDLAEELAVALYFLAQAKPDAVADLESEVVALLARFDQTGALTTKGVGVVSWARG